MAHNRDKTGIVDENAIEQAHRVFGGMRIIAEIDAIAPRLRLAPEGGCVQMPEGKKRICGVKSRSRFSLRFDAERMLL